MNNEHELERLIDRELKQLAPPRAPRTLMPRVLGEVRRRAAAPWYQRAWFTWPRQWQVVSAAALAAVLVGIAMLLPEIHVGKAAGNFTSRVADATESTGAGVNAALVLWRALLQPVIGYVLVFVAVMFAACAAFGTALGRVLAKNLKFA